MTMDCNKCTRQVDYPPVPFVVHENLRAQMDMHARRLVRVIVLLVVLLFASNAFWVWRESQFMDISIEQEVDAGDGDAFVVGNGDLNYGEGQTEDNETCP